MSTQQAYLIISIRTYSSSQCTTALRRWFHRTVFHQQSMSQARTDSRLYSLGNKLVLFNSITSVTLVEEHYSRTVFEEFSLRVINFVENLTHFTRFSSFNFLLFFGLPHQIAFLLRLFFLHLFSKFSLFFTSFCSVLVF